VSKLKHPTPKKRPTLFAGGLFCQQQLSRFYWAAGNTKKANATHEALHDRLVNKGTKLAAIAVCNDC
jgi:hypothetical protein